MAHQDHSQHLCATCRQPTLHIRTVPGVNHVLHLLVTVLLCGVWLPIWVLAAMFPPKPEPFRCTVCGTSASDSEKAFRQENRAAKKAAKAEARSAPEAVAAREAKSQRWREQRQAMVREILSAPGRVDRGLRFISGEGNDIIYRALQVVVIVACVAIPAALIWLVAR